MASPHVRYCEYRLAGNPAEQLPVASESSTRSQDSRSGSSGCKIKPAGAGFTLPSAPWFRRRKRSSFAAVPDCFHRNHDIPLIGPVLVGDGIGNAGIEKNHTGREARRGALRLVAFCAHGSIRRRKFSARGRLLAQGRIRIPAELPHHNHRRTEAA